MLARPALIFFLLTFSVAAGAEVIRQYFRVQSGTGFFVSYSGYLLTNEHVVKGCHKVIVKGPQFAETEADVYATDHTHDLALIRTPTQPQYIANLRDDIEDLKPGDEVLAVGYPGDAWKTGKYKVSDAKMVDTHGPSTHPDWIEFTQSITHGNSGGPLVDRSGNVIGIVVAMLFQTHEMYQVNRQSGERKLLETTHTRSSGAIGLAVAEEFMRNNGVDFHVSISGPEAADSGIEEMVRRYIVNVQCRNKITEAEAAALPDHMQDDAAAEQ